MDRVYSQYADGIIQQLSLKHKSGKEFGDVPCPNPKCGGKDRFYINEYNGLLRHHCRKSCDYIERDQALQDRGLLPKWQASSQVPYHMRKGLPLIGARLENSNLVVPISHVQTGEQVGTQVISPDGSKRFSKGMKKSGTGAFLGERTSTLYLVEGWATGVAVHLSTEQQVLFALDADTLVKTARLLDHPNIIVAADNDKTGIAAAEATGRPWVVPENAGEDWWDVFNRVGKDGVARGLNKTELAIENEDSDPIVIRSEDEFVKSLEIPDPIVDGLIARGRSYSLTANTGHAKTALASYLMCAVSEPEAMPWERVHDKCDVLFCSGENPDDLKMRILGHRNENPKLQGSGRYYIEGIFDLEHSYTSIKEKAAIIPDLGLIIIDTKQAFQTIENDNDNAENLRFASACRKLTFLPSRPAVVVLCHPIKNASKENLVPRGGSSYLNEVDGNLSQWRSGEIVTLHWSGKFRGRDFDPIKFKLKTATHPVLLDRYGRKIETVILERLHDLDADELRKETLKLEDKVLLSVYKYPEQSIADRCFDCGLKNDKNEAQKSTMHRLLQALSEQKFIKKVRRRWELTPAGKKEVERLQDA